MPMTRATIRSTAQQSAGLQGATANFLSAAQWNELIDEAVRDLHSLSVRATRNNPLVLSTSTAITTTSGTDLYTLPTGLLELIEVDRRPTGTTKYYQMMPYQGPERLISVEGFPIDPVYRYRLHGFQLQLDPIPTVTGDTIRLKYIPEAVLFTADSGETLTTLGNYPLQAERYVVLHVAVDALLQARGFQAAQALQARLSKVEAEIQADLGMRNSVPKRIVDVYRRS